MSNHPPPVIDLGRLRFLAEDKALREKMNGRQVAASIGISHAAYCRFMQGHGGLSVHSFYRLSEWLGITDQSLRTFALPTVARRVTS